MTVADVMNNVEVQQSIVETTLTALADSAENSLRGTFVGATSATTRRLSSSRRKNRSAHMALSDITSMMVLVSYTMEDFSYSTPDDALDSFRNKFGASWSSGSFLSSFTSTLLRMNPHTSVNVNGLTQISNKFSPLRVVVTNPNPTARPTLSALPTVSPSTSAPTVSRLAPSITGQQTSSTKVSITVSVAFSPAALYSGNLYCAALPDGTAVTSVNQVVLASTSVSYLVGSSSGSVTITNLKELTTYNTYCYLRNILGFGNSLVEVQGTKAVVTTSCCRTMSFTNSPTTVYADTAAQYTSSQTLRYYFIYTLSSAPSSTVTIQPKLFFPNGTGVPTSYIAVHPASAVYTLRSPR